VVGYSEVVGASVVGSSSRGVLVLRGAEVVLGAAVVARGDVVVVRGVLGLLDVLAGASVAEDDGAGAVVAGAVALGAVVGGT